MAPLDRRALQSLDDSRVTRAKLLVKTQHVRPKILNAGETTRHKILAMHYGVETGSKCGALQAAPGGVGSPPSWRRGSRLKHKTGSTQCEKNTTPTTGKKHEDKKRNCFCTSLVLARLYRSYLFGGRELEPCCHGAKQNGIRENRKPQNK